MIDTVVLTLSKDMYRISEPDKFEPSAQWVDNTSYKLRGIQSRQNPTKKELRAGIYKPRLTISNRINSNGARNISLKVELSLPKLLFGNNFNELMLKDLANITNKLAQVLETMGIIITPAALAKAPVSAVHYSKNIPLTNGSMPYYYINKIKDANIKLSLDVNKSDFRNEGHSYKWHCNSYEVVFYDKLKDLEAARKSNKRTLEKDADLQLDLFDSLRAKKQLEILRMEVRLNKRVKIKALFKKLNIKATLTLKGLFKPNIAKQVLLHYLDELENKRPALLNYRATNDKDLLSALLINNPEVGPKQILQMFGLKKAFETVNPRELRNMFAHYNARSWYRLIADANKIQLPGSQGCFDGIRECLIKFKALRIHLI